MAVSEMVLNCQIYKSLYGWNSSISYVLKLKTPVDVKTNNNEIKMAKIMADTT